MALQGIYLSIGWEELFCKFIKGLFLNFYTILEPSVPPVYAGTVILYCTPTTLPHTCHPVKIYATNSLRQALPEEDDRYILANEKAKV